MMKQLKDFKTPYPAPEPDHCTYCLRLEADLDAMSVADWATENRPAIPAAWMPWLLRQTDVSMAYLLAAILFEFEDTTHRGRCVKLFDTEADEWDDEEYPCIVNYVSSDLNNIIYKLSLLDLGNPYMTAWTDPYKTLLEGNENIRRGSGGDGYGLSYARIFDTRWDLITLNEFINHMRPHLSEEDLLELGILAEKVYLGENMGEQSVINAFATHHYDTMDRYGEDRYVSIADARVLMATEPCAFEKVLGDMFPFTPEGARDLVATIVYAMRH